MKTSYLSSWKGADFGKTKQAYQFHWDQHARIWKLCACVCAFSVTICWIHLPILYQMHETNDKMLPLNRIELANLPCTGLKSTLASLICWDLSCTKDYYLVVSFNQNIYLFWNVRKFSSLLRESYKPSAIGLNSLWQETTSEFFRMIIRCCFIFQQGYASNVLHICSLQWFHGIS